MKKVGALVLLVALNDYSAICAAAQDPKGQLILTGHCADVGSLDSYKGSSFNDYSPVPSVLEHLGYRWNKKRMDYSAPPAVVRSVKSGLVEAPRHGTLTLTFPHTWSYVAASGYEGNDQVRYFVEVTGRRYVVIENILVHKTVNEQADPAECEMAFRPGSNTAVNRTLRDKAAQRRLP